MSVKVDKKIPIGVIITIMIQLVTLIYLSGKYSEKFINMEDRYSERFNNIDVKLATVDKTLQDRVQVANQVFERIARLETRFDGIENSIKLANDSIKTVNDNVVKVMDRQYEERNRRDKN